LEESMNAQDLKEVISRLVEQIKQNNVVFFVGAGISIPSGAPSAKDIIEKAVEKIFDISIDLSKKEIEKLRELCLKKARPETFFNYYELYREKTKDISKIKKIDEMFEYFKKLEPTYLHHSLASLVKAGFVKNIICLNYDQLIEKACEALGQTLRVYYTREDFEDYFDNSIENVEPAIFKIHGSLSEEKKESLQMAIGQLIPFDPNKAELIKKFMREKSFVFIGYSGNDDFDVTPILLDHAAKKTFYWVNHEDGREIQLMGCKNSSVSSNPLKIICEQNKKACKHYYITGDTKTFIKEIIGQINKDPHDGINGFDHYSTKGEIQGERAKVFDEAGGEGFPDVLKKLILTHLLMDYGYYREALKVTKSGINKEEDLYLYFENQLLKNRIFRKLGIYGHSIFELEKLENEITLELRKEEYPKSKEYIGFLCSIYKNLAFIYRDMAKDEESEEKKNQLWQKSLEMFDIWHKKLKEAKFVFDYEQFQSNFYEVECDRAWLLRDQGKLNEAIKLMAVEYFPDLYNKSKACIDIGWFFLDEAKRRYLKKINGYEDYLENAQKYFNTALSLADKGGYVEIKARGLRDLSHVFLFRAVIGKYGMEKKSRQEAEQMKRDAEINLNTSANLYNLLGLENQKAVTKQDQALYFYALDENKKAKKLIKEALDILKESGVKRDIKKAEEIQQNIKNGKPYVWYLIEALNYLIR
jgi:NAD-dependent SIR2 family protein deacetylase